MRCGSGVGHKREALDPMYVLDDGAAWPRRQLKSAFAVGEGDIQGLGGKRISGGWQ
jgi:hypothetical protein